jgi:hypothetical protein
MASKKNMPAVRRVRVGGTPVPMPSRTIPRAPGSAVPVPMPRIGPNLGKTNPAKARRAPSGPKKSGTSGPAMPSRTKRSPARRKMI